jgi:hypothetical protein
MAVAVSCQPAELSDPARRVPLSLVRPAPRAAPARPARSVYWARRTLAFAALVIVATALAFGMRAVVVGLGGGPLTTTGSAGAVLAPGAGARVYVAQPGDSVWSIVRASGVRGDPRPVVDRLERKLGGRSLQIGQRVVVP